jgi:hypothetical protein
MKHRPGSPPSTENHQKDNFVDVRRAADKNVINFSRIQRWLRAECSLKGGLLRILSNSNRGMRVALR